MTEYNVIGRLHFGVDKFAMGISDTPELAIEIVDALNAKAAFDEVVAQNAKLTTAMEGLLDGSGDMVKWIAAVRDARAVMAKVGDADHG